MTKIIHNNSKIGIKKFDKPINAWYDCGMKKVVVITGASSGIGFSAAEYFASKGYKVYGLSRRTAEGKFESVRCDVTDCESVRAALSQIYIKEKRIDCFINNAGIGISGAVEHIPEENTKKLFDVNVLAYFSCAKAVIPYLKQTKGVLINTSSVAAVIPIPYQTAYSASKAAINLFGMSLNLELKKFGVRVCTVMPGDTKTGFTAAREKTLNDAGYEDSLNRSVGKMEHDEKNGKSPLSVAKVMFKLAESKNPPALKTVGFAYKCVVFLNKILPARLMMRIVKKMYG